MAKATKADCGYLFLPCGWQCPPINGGGQYLTTVSGGEIGAAVEDLRVVISIQRYLCSF